jgi:hypothetical protein
MKIFVMNKCAAILVLLLLSPIARADPGFVKSLPPEDFATAGLQKLTPEELTRLEALVQRYKAGEVAEVRQQAAAKASVSQREAEQKVVAAETKAREAEARADEVAKASRAKAAAPVTGKQQPGWFKALVTLNLAGEKPDKQEPLESRLVGSFQGWNGHSVFTLENGTSWVQQNKTETYAYWPVISSPKVKIRPAAISGFWLEVEGVNRQLRVIPLNVHEVK